MQAPNATANCSVGGWRWNLRSADIAQEGNQHRGEDEGDHDGEKGVRVGQGRRLAIGEEPELLERRLVACLRVPRDRGVALSEAELAAALDMAWRHGAAAKPRGR